MRKCPYFSQIKRDVTGYMHNIFLQFSDDKQQNCGIKSMAHVRTLGLIVFDT